MLKLTATIPNGKLIVLGITEGDISRLKSGQTIVVKGDSIEVPGIEIVIFYGKDLAHLREQAAPLIGPDTKVRNDPLLDEVPENARACSEGQNRGKL